MKKNVLVFVSLAIALLAGCSNSNNNTATEIDAENWVSDKGLSVQDTFNSQIEQTQYIVDLNDFLSYEIMSEVEDKPYTSEYVISAKLDNESAIQGGLEFNQSKVSKSHNLENSEISFNVAASMESGELDPFAISGDLSLLYKDDDMYANVHDFGLYMGEENMVAKMYTLLLDMLKGKWVDLEASDGGIISITDDFKLGYLVGSLENILEVGSVQPASEFVSKVAGLINAINSYIDLGIYTDGLNMESSDDFQYSELSDGTIQKSFTGSFKGTYSSFDMAFVASKKGIDIRFYNMKSLDDETQEFYNANVENIFSLQEVKKSEYNISFQSINNGDNVAKLDGNLKYSAPIKLSAKFELTPNRILTGQKISGNLDGKVIKKFSDGKESIPELTGDILLLSELLDTL